MVTFTASGAKIWPVPPDWSNGVQESLSWLTDVMQASATAVSQHRGLRATPRRSFTFEVLAEGQMRRVADMLLAGHGGEWLLPIWPDVQWLGAPLAAGGDIVPCATAGYDFVEGGRALLYTSVNAWEVVEIRSIGADYLAFDTPIGMTCKPGSRLYPLRRARVQDGAEERLYSDAIGRRSLSFDIIEPCDWPPLAAPTRYLGHPVLDTRPDESEDPTSSYSRLAQTVDYETSLPVVHDLPGLSLRAQQTHWTLAGRAAHARFRSLLYTLDGRRVPVWVPSFSSDLKPVATVAADSTELVVEWAGYTLFGAGRPNRRDLRIELTDGTVLYRRILDAFHTGDGRERLTLASPLSASSLAPHRFRQISFMALSTLASDDVEIDHATDQDGVATCTLGWQAVVPDV